jgi:non-canonical (house-cleaning) NTP pyrophosphatase
LRRDTARYAPNRRLRKPPHRPSQGKTAEGAKKRALLAAGPFVVKVWVRINGGFVRNPERTDTSIH